MNLLKNASKRTSISEDASGGAVGAGAVSAVAMPLFSTLVQRSTTSMPPVQVIKYGKVQKKPKAKRSKLGLSEAFMDMYEDDASLPPKGCDFDTTDVIA